MHQVGSICKITQEFTVNKTQYKTFSHLQGYVKGETPPGDLEVDKIVSDTEYWDAN